MGSKTSRLGWLTLAEASELLGVHGATLRKWADHGHVNVFRTPGGHRRFLLSDIQALAQTGVDPQATLLAPNNHLVVATVENVRQDLSNLAATKEPWLASFTEDDRRAWRDSGKSLLGLAIQYVARGQRSEEIVAEAKKIGGRYGRTCADRGIRLVGMTRAFLFFRESVLRTARPGLLAQGQYDSEEVRVHRELRQFLDEVLYAMLDAYDRPRLPQAAGEG